MATWYCSDGPCIERNVARGTPSAQAAYQALSACADRSCQIADSYCDCEQECFVDGNCQAETMACVAGITDLFCEQLCH